MLTETSVDQPSSAMKAAFESKYGRDWNDPAGNDMKAIWFEAWNASRHSAKAQLISVANQLRSIPLSGRIGDWHNAQETADAFDSCAEFLASTN